MSDSFHPHGLQYVRLPWLLPSPRICSNSCPLSWWYCLTISSFAALFSFCLQSFCTSVSFSMGWFFESRGKSIGASASSSVLPMNVQGWLPLGLTGLILQSKGPFKNLLQQRNSEASIFWHSAFFMVQLSHPYRINWKNHSFDCTDLCWQRDVSAV